MTCNCGAALNESGHCTENGENCCECWECEHRRAMVSARWWADQEWDAEYRSILARSAADAE